MRLRTVTTCSVAVIAINVCSASDALSVATPAVIASRPTLSVEGSVRSDVNTDLLALSYDDRAGTLEFTLNNWANANYSYSEATLLRPGTTVSVLVGSGSASTKLAEGQVTELAPNFTDTGTRTITIRAAAVAPQASSGTLQVVYGRTLAEFYPVLKADGSISCTGTVSSLGELVRGMTLQVGGVGSRFGGNYRVSGTVHSFDSTHGMRTTFTATKPAPKIKAAGPRSG